MSCPSLFSISRLRESTALRSAFSFSSRVPTSFSSSGFLSVRAL